MFLTTNEVNQKMDRRTFITSTTAAAVGLATPTNDVDQYA
jgi:hypothetical protein